MNIVQQIKKEFFEKFETQIVKRWNNKKNLDNIKYN